LPHFAIMQAWKDSDNEGDASRAYAAVTAQLNSWTSPKVGTRSSNWSVCEEDAVQWMETSMSPPPSESLTLSIPLTPQRRSPDNESSTPGTPIMSNSAKKSSGEKVSLHDLMTVETVPNDVPGNATTDEYRLHHDAFLRFIRARNAIYHQFSLSGAECCQKDELAIDLDYLQTLAIDQYPIWSLLVKLRSLGLDAIWMDDTENVRNVQQKFLSETVSSASGPALRTHAELVQDLYGETAPMLLKRRKAILEWLEDNAAKKDIKHPRKISSSQIMWPASTKALRSRLGNKRPDKIQSVHPDAPLLISEKATPLFGTDGKSDKDLLQACLLYILSGRLEKATELCRAHGQPWRAAVWQGGEPFKIDTLLDREEQTMTILNSGNPSRILWKSHCRKLARATSDEESAIYAILANDTHTALSNSCLRSWESGLYVCMSSMVGRLEDELIRLYNSEIRKAGLVFPGSDNEREEIDYLATANEPMFTEASIITTLRSSPFKGMQGETIEQEIMAAFIQGRNSVVSLLRNRWLKSSEKPLLRTMTHLLFFLYSLAEKPESSIEVDGLKDMVEGSILHYIHQLSERPDLVQFSVVYASMLPTETMLEFYPKLLTNVQVPDERRLLWEKMKDLFEEGMDLRIIKSVVKLMLTDKDLKNIQKCQAIGWLCFTQCHYEEALNCANSLVRQLLLRNEEQVANEFLWQYFPKMVQSNDKEGFVSTKREHDALQVYLEANEAFERWKECMMNSTAECEINDIDQTNLNEIERDISLSMKKRSIIEEKQKVAQKVIFAANTAQCKLDEVLTFGGGWLQEYEDDDDVEDDEERQRQEELKKLQSELIPQIVFMAHNVYDETATWMKTMLEDAIPILGNNTREVLSVLDPNVDEVSSTPLAPLYWLHHAEALVEKVASEEYNVYDSFGGRFLKTFLGHMENVTIRLLEESAIVSEGVQ